MKQLIPIRNQNDFNIQSKPVKDRSPSGCSSIFFSPLAACAIRLFADYRGKMWVNG